MVLVASFSRVSWGLRSQREFLFLSLGFKYFNYNEKSSKKSIFVMFFLNARSVFAERSPGPSAEVEVTLDGFHLAGAHRFN